MLSFNITFSKYECVFADSTDKDERNRSSIECSCEKQNRTKKVKILNSLPSETMASSEAKSISRPQSITVDGTSKCGSKKSTRYVQIDTIKIFTREKLLMLFLKMVALLSFWWYKWF